ncbi:hypothetical protein Patl1_07553 [Pistacia atlantica]|uniref:Uncharacterized protein n=1 Tax=Pistacia atlantica TaxID=434234 RepID=A0ACC1AG26_9ROSI|nr:hypothetical protein Patl1_07553 [Pistacia atlantica]
MEKVPPGIAFLEEGLLSPGLVHLVLLVLANCKELNSKMARSLMLLILLDSLIFLLNLNLLGKKLSNVLNWPKMVSMQSL